MNLVIKFWIRVVIVEINKDRIRNYMEEKLVKFSFM